MSNYVNTVGSSTMSVEPDENLFKEIFKEYEHVIVETLITSFGLDFLIHDQLGGDVDTIHNVRQVGFDENGGNSPMMYKNPKNFYAYEGREDYDSTKYHGDPTYKNIIRNAKRELNEEGKMIRDAYTGRKILPNKGPSIEKQAQLDHVKSAKSIHDDRGRVLADLDGVALANSSENLKFTNACLNNNMKDKSIPEYIEWCEKNPNKVNWNGKKGEPLPADVKAGLMREYKNSTKVYEAKLAKAYYTSPKFAKDLSLAAGAVGIQMGLRQAFGLFFAEVWFSVKEEFEKIDGKFELEKFLIAVKDGVRKGYQNAMSKYDQLFAKFKEGATAGIFASVTTTLCNIFFTTAKNIVKIIRHSYASIVQACEVLFINPQNYPFGERVRATTKVIATGASVVTGVLVSEGLNDSILNKVKELNPTLINVIDAVSDFCGALTTGIMSCTILFYLDHSKIVNKLVNYLNTHILTIDATLEEYKQLAYSFRIYAAELMNIDVEKFIKEVDTFYDVACNVDEAKDERELNTILKQTLKSLDIKFKYESFDDFMNDKNSKLVFE